MSLSSGSYEHFISFPQCFVRLSQRGCVVDVSRVSRDPRVSCSLRFDQLWISMMISNSCKKRSIFDEGLELHLSVDIRTGIQNAAGNYALQVTGIAGYRNWQQQVCLLLGMTSQGPCPRQPQIIGWVYFNKHKFLVIEQPLKSNQMEIGCLRYKSRFCTLGYILKCWSLL